MNIKSKMEKYVHKGQNLSRVHKFAYLDNSKFKFEHMNDLRMSRQTRWSYQICQKSAKNVSRVQVESRPQNQKSKKIAIFTHSKQRSARRASGASSKELV